MLSDEEYASARESTLTAFYTPPVVIKAVYSALENMRFSTGNVLEPSCGIGNFMGLVPESMNDAKFYGVELDSISGRIAQQLYQKNSIAVQGFESTNLPDSFFDAAIGNVPSGSSRYPTSAMTSTTSSFTTISSPCTWIGETRRRDRLHYLKGYAG